MITPNFLTWLRLAAAPVIPIVFLQGGNQYKYLAAIIYTAAAFTDLLDGILARRRQQITPLGKILDPIADKVLVLGALIAFVIDGVLNAIWLLPIVAREVSVTAARILLLGKKQVIAATASGKLKVAVQHAAVFFLFLISLRLTLFQSPLKLFLYVSAYTLLIAAVWFTIKSGYDFFKANGAALIERKNS